MQIINITQDHKILFSSYKMNRSIKKHEETNKKNRVNVKAKILFVEDNAIIRNITLRYLENLGCEVSPFSEGVAAINHYKNHIKKYDLVILDIGLPYLSGLDICRYIKHVFQDYDTPIVAYTAFGNQVKDECYRAGFNDFLIKPVTEKKFAELIEKWLHINFKEN